MITMTIHYGEEVQQRKLPCDFLSLRMSLYQMNLMHAPSEVSVRDVQAEFTSDDPLGQKLMADSFDSINDIAIQRDHLLDEMCGFRQTYYFPLTCSTPDEDGELHETSVYGLTRYSEEIQDAIEADQKRDIDTMAMYFWTHDQKVNESIRAKLLTCKWGVASLGFTLYGQVEVTATESFTEKEVRAMKEWISGQNSDGLGESFENRPIETEDGDLHVHFWHSGNDYFIVTDSEVDQELHVTAHGIDGGMTGMSM